MRLNSCQPGGLLFVLGTALLLGLPSWALGQTTGPPSGSLVVVGGGMQDPAIVKRFVELAGGPQASIVVIPTAGGGEEYDQFYPGLRTFRNAGAHNLVVLHTKDREVADSESFVEPIRSASGVWFPGGRQWRLADSYLGTRTERELHALLERGGVIGGSSAGATIQGDYLVRGDTKTNTIMMGDHTEGFGFMKNVAIDQHVLRRNRQFDLIPVIETHPQLLGIGLDENTAIVVRGNQFEVMGAGYVLIYDHNKMVGTDGKFYFLAPGDRFSMESREASRSTPRLTPLQGIESRSWQK